MAPQKIRILLVSKKTDVALKLRRDLSSIDRYLVRFAETSDAAMTAIVEGSPHCVIFNFENFGENQVRLLQGVRQISNAFQIVAFTDKVEPESFDQMKTVKGLAIVEKPLLNLNRDLTGLCERLISGEEHRQRESKRMITEQKIQIELLNSGMRVEGKMVDMTSRGACVELPGIKLKVGSRLKVTIELDDLSRKRVVTCEVRWAKKPSYHTIAGVLFVKN